MALALYSSVGPSAAIAAVVETIDAGVGPDFPVLALDPLGQPHVFYTYPDAALFVHASKRAGAWTIEQVTPPRNDVLDLSATTDEFGRLHVAFGSFWNSLFYGKKSEGTWFFEVADGKRLPGAGATGFSSSLAIDTAGNPQIAFTRLFIDPNESLDRYVNYAFKTPGGAWSRQIVDWRDTSVGFGLSLALDETDDPHLSYVAWNADETLDLVYATRVDGLWRWENVQEAIVDAVSTDIAVDGRMRPHIAFIDNQRDAVVLARKASGTWSFETIDDSSADISWRMTLCLDDRGTPHVTYRDASSGTLIYARKDDGMWVRAELGRPSFTGLSDVALDSGGGVRVAQVIGASNEICYVATGVPSSSTPERPILFTKHLDGSLALSQTSVLVAPNPCGREGTRIVFGERLRQIVDEVLIYDTAGRNVASLRVESPVIASGLRWDGKDRHGKSVAPGRYFLHVRARVPGATVPGPHVITLVR